MARVIDESDPIDDQELILRLVEPSHFTTPYAPSISPRAFEPRIKGRSPDLNGISLFRLACLNDFRDILSVVSPDKRHLKGIVGLLVLSVRELREMRLTVASDKIGELPGHVVIPELNSRDYQQKKSEMTIAMLALATLASHPDHILLVPGSDNPSVR